MRHGLSVAADRPLAGAPPAQRDRRAAVLLPPGSGRRIAVAAGGGPRAERELVLAAVRARGAHRARVVVRLAARDPVQLRADPWETRRTERLAAQLADVVHQPDVRP